LEVVLPRAVVSALLLLLLLEFVDVDHVVIVMSMSMHLTLLRLLSMLLLLPPMLFVLMMSTVEHNKSDGANLVYMHIAESTTSSSINKALLR